MICGNHELYKKKDFPHWLGMSILMGACILSIITYWFYEPFWTWVILDRLGEPSTGCFIFMLGTPWSATAATPITAV